MPTAAHPTLEINLTPIHAFRDLRELVHTLADLAINVTKIGAAVSVPSGHGF